MSGEHPSSLSGVFGQPFAEQIAFFRQKLGNRVPTRRWTDLQGEAHDTQFMVAGALEADLLTDLANAAEKFINEGRGIEEFRRDFRSIVAKNGWTGWTGEGSTKGEAWRVGVIYRTNAYTSYAAGRFAQLKAGNFPFWVYRHGGSQEPRVQHLGWNGLVLPPDHEFWITRYPPSDWGCSCYVVGASSEAAAQLLGGDPDKQLRPGWNRIDARTGLPIGIGKGWNYAPGRSVAGAVNAVAAKYDKWPADIGSRYGETMTPAHRAQLADAFESFVEEALSGPPQGRSAVLGVLRPQWIEEAQAAGISPASAEIIVRDRDVWHSFRDTKAAKLDLAWYKRLPERINRPSAVLLDKSDEKRPAFLLVFDTGPDRAKLVVSINYRVKKVEGLQNVLTTGRMITEEDLRAQIGEGQVSIIEGVL